MIDFNNKEDLEKLYSFTFYISGECPSDIINVQSDCLEDRDCLYCWRRALNLKKEEMESKNK